ncbi:MAG: hypothetical protein ACTTIO_02070 [Candidatus Fimenecus sp.]
MKKLFSLFISVLFICGLVVPAIALSSKEKPNYYHCENGKTIIYYLDKDGIPFIYENGKKETVLLPLEQFRITDEVECAKLDAEYEAFKEAERLEFENFVAVNKERSLFYNGTISIPGFAWTSLPQRTNAVVLKFSNPKPIFSNREVNITFRFRNKFTGGWFEEHKNNQNLFQHEVKYPADGEISNALKISFSPCGGLKSAFLSGRLQMA